MDPSVKSSSEHGVRSRISEKISKLKKMNKGGKKASSKGYKSNKDSWNLPPITNEFQSRDQINAF